MRITLLLILLGGLFNVAYSQKPALDTSVLDKWPYVRSPFVSPDGNYVGYIFENQSNRGPNAIIYNTRTWKKLEFDNVREVTFSMNSKNIFYKKNDSLFIISLDKQITDYAPGCQSFQLLNDNKVKEWLVCKLVDSANSLLVRNLEGGRDFKFTNVSDYWMGNGRGEIIIGYKGSNDSETSLQWIDLATGDTKNLWRGLFIGSLVWNASDNMIAFLGKDTLEGCKNAIWYWEKNMAEAKKAMETYSFKVRAGFDIGNITMISNDKNKIFFSIKGKGSHPALASFGKPITENINVWNYRDPKIMSQQMRELEADSFYYEVLNREKDKVWEVGYQMPTGASSFQISNDQKYILVTQSEGGDLNGEWNWNESAHAYAYLSSTEDGTKREISNYLSNPGINANAGFSPSGNYIVYYDGAQKNYFSYNIVSRELINITKGISDTWTSYETSDMPIAAYFPIGIAGFVKNDNAVLIYSQNDIYQVDLDGRTSAINLTNGYGKMHGIVFRLATERGSTDFIQGHKTLLTGFSNISKEDGYYNTIIGENSNPTKLLSESSLMGGAVEDLFTQTELPTKAKNSECYVVRKMTATKAPNYFFTKDFKTFRQLSFLQPEANYNWLTTELISWQSKDSQVYKGILYKPENFDPNRKYPLIIYYYERLSDELNYYIPPTYSDGVLNIPYFVSNGYLVFTPDIHYKIGWPGKSAYNAVTSGLSYLSQRPYINMQKVGLQGHSFGGFETNYIITHSNSFAAAMSSSGMSDFVSIYNSIIGSGQVRQKQYEMYRDRIGATLWERPDLYLENSPVLRADRVTTPLLMMANKDDGDVPYMQGVELFASLRRLGKKVWLLSYDDGDHLVGGDDAKDLTIRMFQFFNYYLKDAPPPKWMTQGVPARQKGIDSGLGYDTSGQKP